MSQIICNPNNPPSAAMKNPPFRKLCRLLLIILLLTIRPVAAPCLPDRVNLNTATARQLQELPYIGESRAAAIIKYRQGHGPFTSFDQLLAVPGIGRDSLEAMRPYLAIGNAPGPQTAQPEVSYHQKITTSPGDIVTLPDDRYYDTLVDFIRGADHSIDMVMFLFKTTSSKGNKPASLLRELLKARAKGVQIRVLLENSGYDPEINKENRKAARTLSKNGIDVSFDSPATTTHAKFVVIDRRYVFLGSHNLTHSALSSNHEFSLLIDNTTLAAELVQYRERLR
ncbi:MAG: phospholipase [Desulfurivibrio sp.]|jgi:competence ComEA-like helix-hairpin-helix protein|nr:MAG: phospholipase [Desulfurivibrio sp.]